MNQISSFSSIKIKPVCILILRRYSFAPSIPWEIDLHLSRMGLKDFDKYKGNKITE